MSYRSFLFAAACIYPSIYPFHPFIHPASQPASHPSIRPSVHQVKKVQANPKANKTNEKVDVM